MFCACRCFSYKLLLFFSFLREFFTFLLVKYFSVEQKQSSGGVLSYVSPKINQKTPVLESFLSVKLQDVDLQLYLKETSTPIFSYEFCKKITKKLHCRCLIGFKICLTLWQVLVGKINGWKKKLKKSLTLIWKGQKKSFFGKIVSG